MRSENASASTPVTAATATTTSKPRRSGKRGNGEGSVTQLSDGRWQARVTLEGGRRKAFYGATRAEAAQQLTAALRDRDRGLPLVGEKQTVGQYLDTWIESVRPQIRASSHRRYSDYVRIHLTPGLGRIALAKLTPQQVQFFYSRKLAEGLSSSTVHHIHGALHRALEDAMRMGLTPRNIADMVRAPRRLRTEVVTLQEEQVKQLLMAIEGDRFEALYWLALTTGMREGELLGLRWQDVDLERRTAACV